MKTLSPRKGMTESDIAATVEGILAAATLEENVEIRHTFHAGGSSSTTLTATIDL